MAELQHAFLSYLREDADAVDRLQVALGGAGVKVWRDRDNLGPGDAWKTKIRGAAQQESLAFIALLSTNSVAKERSHQRPELLLAAEEYQLRPPERTWLFPVRLDECNVPSLELGGARYLTNLQWTDVFGTRAEQDFIRTGPTAPLLEHLQTFPLLWLATVISIAAVCCRRSRAASSARSGRRAAGPWP